MLRTRSDDPIDLTCADSSVPYLAERSPPSSCVSCLPAPVHIVKMVGLLGPESAPLLDCRGLLTMKLYPCYSDPELQVHN